MKTIDLADLSTVTGGNLASSSPSRPGLDSGGSWDKWSAPRPTGPTFPKPPTMPLGPFVPNDSQRQIA